MFEFLPIEIECLIFKSYYSQEIVPHLNKNNEIIKKNKLKNYYKTTLLPDLINISIMDKIGRLINHIINNVITNIKELDNLFYNLLELHTCKIIDIFD
jgi:hypothetical protein